MNILDNKQAIILIGKNDEKSLGYKGFTEVWNKPSTYEIIFKKRFVKGLIYRIIKEDSFFDLEEEITW